MKIGIITLHKIINFGSALQAYALQKYIQIATNEDVEIIDYIFPNKSYRENASFLIRLRSNLRLIYYGIFKRRYIQLYRFRLFYKKYLHLSKKTYDSDVAIMKRPPLYDVYLTGSDQVWNVKTLYNNPIMYCSFAPFTAKKISYGASFATKDIPFSYRDEIKHRLLKYSHIGVREYSSLEILKTLEIPDSISQVCTSDPTLLLSAEDYECIVSDSKIHIKTEYILVYYLNYAFDPEPVISYVSSYVQKKYNLPIIYIGSKGFKRYVDGKKIYNYTGLGPCEFAYLIKNAKHVITSSFHGTMFAIIFRKPFTAILPNSMHSDTRIKDVLKTLGLEVCGIEADSNIKDFQFLDYPYDSLVEEKIKYYIDRSRNFLINSIYN